MELPPAPSVHLLGGNSTAYVGTPGPAPYTTASLTANLVLRVTLAVAANGVCLVPLRVLYRNGEFAAAVFIATVELLNLETVVSSLVWRDDNVWAWWPGWGLCDVVVHVHNAVAALFITCLLAIMRNLAQQVGLMRAGPLSGAERRRRNLVQALIMFPLPVVQLAWTLPAAARRYEVGALMGCTWASHSSWPYLALFVFPPVVISLATAGYAVLTYHRYRQIAKTTETALSSNLRASRRSQRTRRRLYMMVTSILVPYLPLVVAVAVGNVLEKSGGERFDFDAIHHRASPPWPVVLFYPSSEIDWVNLNNCYINVLVAVPVFLFFGTTKDAVNEYRAAAVFVGLGRLFPALGDEYDPDRTPSSGTTLSWSQAAVTLAGSPSSLAKVSSSFSSRQLSSLRSEPSSTATARGSPFRAAAAAAWADPERGRGAADLATRPWEAGVSAPDPARHRMPFPFRTRLNFRLPLARSRAGATASPSPPPLLPLASLRPAASPQRRTSSAGHGFDTYTPDLVLLDEEELRLFRAASADTTDGGS